MIEEITGLDRSEMCIFGDRLYTDIATGRRHGILSCLVLTGETKEADVDAFVFDAFSNGSDKTIEANLFNFIETIQSAKPGVPIIFMRTIRKENRNFNTRQDADESRKIAKAEELMAQALKKYKDVYLIDSNAADMNHDTTSDGTHPSDWGYHIWAESIRRPILKILKKYGIK